jgi:hypothetical protein
MEHDLQDVTPSWFRPQPRSPHQVYGEATLKDIQRTLSCPETGVMDAVTVTHIKGLQNLFGITPTGVIDVGTAIQIERLRRRYEVISH